MKNIDLTSQFILFLAITLIVVLGAMNSWFYHDHTSHLTEALENRATAKMNFLESSTSYYLKNFEHELIFELGKEAMLIDKGVVFLSIEDADGKKLFEKGNLSHKDSQTFSRQIIKDGDKKGELTFSLDIRQLIKNLRDTMLYTIGLMILSVSLIGGMIYLFYRKKILNELNVRKATEKKLGELNESLESRVDERTSELKQSNESLFKENQKRTLAERQLIKAKERAESASQEKTKFLASMSHELRTPLNAIMGFSQLLGLEADVSAKTKNKADKIYTAGAHLLDLINKVLDLATIESGKLKLTLEPVDLHDILNECHTLIKPQADKLSIHFELSASSNPISVLADRTRLKQVVLNLASNAIKYNRDDGSIHISCDEDSDGNIHIAVRDTGHGIEASRIDELFEPFNRLGKETGTIEGTGIGLMLTREMVEAMGFKLGIDSVVGEGSTFSTIIPSSCLT